ncbi:MAG: hypothetical protein M1819_007361 [Sarea resinae]|nr:MAG: hypothetical protein M1819_007361 [Sarea resinae]
MPLKIIVDNTSAHSSERSSLSDEDSSGVQVSPGSSDSLDEADYWVLDHPDEIGPSDSASRPCTSRQHRPLVERPRTTSSHRQPSRRQAVEPRAEQHHPSRAHRRSQPIPSESVEPPEDYSGYAPRGHHPPAHWGHPGGPPPPGYPPVLPPGSSYNPYSNAPPAPPGTQLIPFGAQNGYGYPNPFSPASPSGGPPYFPPAQHGASHLGNPLSPRGGAPYGGGQEMMPYGATSAGYYPYNSQTYPAPPFYPYQVVHSPPLASTPPPPADASKDDEKFARLEKLLMDQKAELEAREAAREAAIRKAEEDKAAKEAKAAADKKAAEEAAAIVAAAAKEAKEAAERKAAEEAAAAAAKAAGDLKAAEEALKAAEEAAAAKEAALSKEAEAAKAAAAAAKPVPDNKKKPIKFKDAVGRKFSFPFHLCNTWVGMEELIKQAFLHVEVIGPHVAEGHYDLVGPNGEIILPQVWETMVEPDWAITMHMWPMPEPPPPPPPAPEPEPAPEPAPAPAEPEPEPEPAPAPAADEGPHTIVVVEPKDAAPPAGEGAPPAENPADIVVVSPEGGPPPPPAAPAPPDGAGVVVVNPPSGPAAGHPRKVQTAKLPPILMWTAGLSRPSGKGEKKPEPIVQHDEWKNSEDLVTVQILRASAD